MEVDVEGEMPSDGGWPVGAPPGLPRAGEHRWWDDLPSDEQDFMHVTGLVRLAAAARLLGVTQASLRRHVHEGRCTGRKFDGEWFVGRETVNRWRLRLRRG